ncbi:hypothetical protein F4804DRAFT_330268 [Jackrogersella minutella]|nr:hypothetical protein F4804DRAFT_330268 [Jackrogersella minutella]
MALSPWQLCFHSDLKCRVRTCNNRRIVNTTVLSPYCKHHVCAVCLKQKTCFKRGHGEERICRHHACIHPTCHASRSKKHPGSPFCAKHACNIKGCDQPRHGPGLCCRKHTCRDCLSPHGHASPPFPCCPLLRSPSPSSSHAEHSCHGHHLCQAHGCESPVFLDPSNRARRFCFRHYCAASPGCEGQRADGEEGAASACRDHTCALYPACAKPRADAAHGLFCKSHECADEGCRKQRYDSGRTRRGAGAVRGPKGVWCADHMCMAALARQEDCLNRREGTPANPVYCADHELCEEAGCGAFCAVRGRNVKLTRCEEHLKSKCAFPTCTLDAEGGAAACRYHVCRAGGCLATLLPPPVPAASVATSLFCDTHRCSEPGCPSPRLATTASSPAAEGDAYCVEHVRRMRTGLGLFTRHRRSCRCGFRGGRCCGRHGGGEDDDDDDSDDADDTVTDQGDGSSTGVGVGVDVGACFCCDGGDCGGHSKKHYHKCAKR